MTSRSTPSTIIGAAIGLATQGRRPVVEIQFADFLPRGFESLVDNVATLRWRSEAGGRRGQTARSKIR